MSVPLKQRFFEDYTPGEIVEFGDYEITEREILDFASRYDPQFFHTDPERAKHSHFGGLVASGWMTGSVLMRLLVDHFISPVASMGSPGLDAVRWLKPVRPGDHLRARVTIVSTRPSSKRDDRGYVKFEQALFNQNDEMVMQIEGVGMYRTRKAGANPA